MKKILQHLSKITCSLAVVFATVAVNTTCNWRYYQEEMDEQLTSLHRYHNE